VFLGAALAALVVACGEDVQQGDAPSQTTLCFDYFQQCVYPEVLNVSLNSKQRCSDAGCHQGFRQADGTITGSTGGAFRFIADSLAVSLALPQDQILSSDMYLNFLAAKGMANLSSPYNSKILQKPAVQVSHGGGQIFNGTSDPAYKKLNYWISVLQSTTGDSLSSTCPAAPASPCPVPP